VNHREYLEKLIGKECNYEKYGRGALLTYNQVKSEQDPYGDNICYDTPFNKVKILEVHEDFVVLEDYKGQGFRFGGGFDDRKDIPVQKVIRIEDIAIDYYSEQTVDQIVSEAKKNYKEKHPNPKRGVFD